MKPSPLLLLTAALAAGLLSAAAQDAPPLPTRPPAVQPIRPQVVPPPPGSAEAVSVPELGANYRIVISATEKGRKTGEISTQTCSAAFQINGCLTLPTEDDSPGIDLSVRGELSELEDGRLRLGYSVGVTTRVPSQTLGMPGSGQPVVSTYTYKKSGATGMLLLQPGRSYELMQISGVAYSLSLTPMETWPAAKAAAPAPASAPRKAAAGAEEKPLEDAARHGPNEEDRRRYEGLSDRAKEKFRDTMREIFSHEEFRNSPEAERRARIRKAFDEVEAEDQARPR